MSQLLARLYAAQSKKTLSRSELLELRPKTLYTDGRTKQSFKDETDINKIMARFDKTGTISHLNKFEGVYADFSDFDFHEHKTKLTQGQAIFDELPAEIRREFGQSPQSFFDYVNDPANVDKLNENLPALGEPGQQLPRKATPDADLEAADAAIETLAAPAST